MGQHAVVRRVEEREVSEPLKVLARELIQREVDRGLGVGVEEPGVELTDAGGVVVPLHDDGVAFLKEPDDLARCRAVADDVAHLEDLVNDLALQRLEHSLQSSEIRVDVT